MKYLRLTLLFVFIIQAQVQAQTPDCTPKEYDRLMVEAKRLAKDGAYDQAINKLQSAKTCQPGREAEVSAEILRVFEQVNGERKHAEEQTKIAKTEKEKAEAEARRIYANDLVFKSEVALSRGDRTSAFKLAEFAYRFVDTLNSNVIQAMMRALYQNDDTDTPFLPWCTHTLIEYPQDVFSTSIQNIALSPDGKLLAIEYTDNDTIKIFNLENDAKLQSIIPDCASPVLAFASNKRNVVVACDGQTIQIWDAMERNLLHEISSNTASITDIVFSHDDKLIAAACRDSTIKIWSLETGMLQKTLPNQQHSISQVIFSKSDTLISFILTNNTIKVWDLSGNQEVLKIGNCANVFQNMDFSSDDKLFAVIADQYAVEIWNIKTNSKVKTLPVVSFTASCLLFLPNRPCLVVGAFDSNIKIWDIQTEKVTLSLVGHSSPITKIALTAKGDRLASSDYSTVKIWELDSLTALQILKGHNSSITSVSASPTDNWIASGSEDKTAKVWDFETMTMIYDFTAVNSEVNHVLFSPDGLSLAMTAQSDSFVRVWNVENHKINIVTGEPSFPFIAFSHDSKWIAVQGKMNSILIVSLKTKQTVDSIQLNDIPYSIDFSHDGRYLAIGTIEGSVIIWDLHKKKLKWSQIAHKLVVTDMKFIPGGVFLASSSGDGTIKIWEIARGRLIQTLAGHTNVVTNIDVSENGKLLASGSIDASMIIWNLDDGIPVYTFHKPKSPYVMDVAFLSEGKRIALACDDNFIKIIELDGACLIKRSRSIDVKEFDEKPAMRERQLAPITMPQIMSNNLQGILDIKYNNETILLETCETWQVAAFADLYTQKIAQTGFPKKADYERALRLYHACLSHNIDNQYFQQKISALEQLWQEKIN